VAESLGEKKPTPLEVIKIESGTSLIINLKGLGSPIKEIKKLIIEVWTERRHKKADDLINHNKAIENSISLVIKIENKKKKKLLTAHDAERLKHGILRNTFALLEEGALIAEIPHTETIDNAKLLESFGTKLLAPPEPSNDSRHDSEEAEYLSEDFSADEHNGDRPRRRQTKLTDD